MKKQITLLIIVLVTSCVHAFAQDRTVKGTIKDKQGLGLPGAAVKIKGTTIGVAADVAGNYAIEAPANATLVFSSVGYQTQEVAVKGRSAINITLDDDNKQLDEIVVIGYGIRAVKDVTGAISSVKAEKFENQNPTSVTDILKGSIPGLSVAMNTSAKGGSVGDLQVRGKSSLSGSVAPLIVLDGVIYPGQLADINPSDIDRVDVLRDASSLAVYGASSAGAVVAITTKKGKTGTPVITFNLNTGLSQLEKNQKYYDPAGFLAWRADGARSSNTANPYYLYSDPNNLPAGVTLAQFMAGSTGDPTTVWLQRLGLQGNEITNYFANQTVDWSKLVFRNGLRQDYTASLSNRTESTSYYMSANVTKNENLIQGGDYKDARFRVNLEGRATKFLSFGVNAQFSSRDEGDSATPLTNNSIDSHEADWTQIINSSPFGNFYKPGTNVLQRIDTDDSGLNQRNPFLGNAYNTNIAIQNVLFATLFAKVDLPFGIKFNMNYAPQIESYRNAFFRPVANPNELAQGTGIRTMESRYRYTLDNILNWNKTFGIHNFDITALLNKEGYNTYYTRTDNTGFSPSDVLGEHSIGSGTLPVESSDDRVYTGDALMARLNYTLLGRYLVTATIRRDGYSPFGLEHPRQTYPSAAVGWIFSDEKFMKGDSFKWLDFGKLRVSYGSNGNRGTTGTADPTIALAVLNTYKDPTATSGGVVTNNTTAEIASLQNADLKWERTTGTDLGLDWSIFKGRISGTVDVYNRKTTDMLVKRQISAIQGYNGSAYGASNNSTPYTNIGEVNNKGFEFSVEGKIVKSKNFNWSAGGTIYINRNKIVHLYGPVTTTDASGNTSTTESNDIGNGWFVGQDINAVWDYKILGVWQTSEATDAAKYGAKPGDFKLQDVDGDFKYTNADKQFLGSTNPKFTWSFYNNINFLKNFDFSCMLVANEGQLRKFNQALNSPGSVGFARQSSYIFPYWTPDNPINDYARLSSGSEGTTINVWRSSSFIRIQTVSLGYNFDKALVKHLGMENAKIFINATNPYVFTKWNFWDPENDGPTPRILGAGINVTF